MNLKTKLVFYKNNFFLLFSVLFLLGKPLQSLAKDSFVWIVEKDGKSSYFLGIIHKGVSLEDLPCSNQILNQIQNSDLIFTETKLRDDLKKLTDEEIKLLIIGSKDEQERILSKLSPESQKFIQERKEVFYNSLKNIEPKNIYSLKRKKSSYRF